MKKLKRFNELYEKAEDAVQMVILITDDGKRIEKEGYAEEGVGIFDYDGNEYPAAIGVNGDIYGSQVDEDDNILCLNGDNIVPGIKMGEVYKPIHENNIEDDKLDKDELLKSLKLIKNNFHMPEVIQLLNDEDVEYYGWTDIEMMIKYLELI